MFSYIEGHAYLLSQGDKEETDEEKAFNLYQRAEENFIKSLDEHVSSQSHFGLAKCYRRFGDKFTDESRIDVNENPQKIGPLKQLVFISPDEKKQYYNSAHYQAGCGMKLCSDSDEKVSTEDVREIAYIKWLIEQNNMSKFYFDLVSKDDLDKFYNAYLIGIDRAFPSRNVSLIRSYEYMLHDAVFHQFIINKCPLYYTAILYLRLGKLYASIGEYNAAIQQYLLSMIDDIIPGQFAMSYGELSRCQLYLDATVFKNIFDRVTQEEYVQIKLAYVMWIKFDLQKKDYMAVAKKIMVADEECFTYEFITEKESTKIQNAFVMLIKEAIENQNYNYAITILCIPELENSIWDVINNSLTEEQLDKMAQASVSNIEMELTSKNFKKATYKIMRIDEYIQRVADSISAKLWYDMGTALFLTKAYQHALVCYHRLKAKTERSYSDDEIDKKIAYIKQCQKKALPKDIYSQNDAFSTFWGPVRLSTQSRSNLSHKSPI